MTCNINDMTIGDARKIAEMFRSLEEPVPIDPLLAAYDGTCVFVRTVTYHYVGRLRAVSGRFMKLGDAAWVAFSGRWANCLATGDLEEVEPYPGDCLISLDSVVDISLWAHPLPREQK